MTNKPLNYIAPGTKVSVETGDPGADIRGVVIATLITGRGVQYEVAMWVSRDGERDRVCEWLEAFEVEPLRDDSDDR
mgnify:CR=1 FL=1